MDPGDVGLLDVEVARAEEARERCGALEKALARAEELRGKVRPAAFLRVEHDYRSRLADARRRLETHRQAAIARLDEMRRARAGSLSRVERIEEERDELLLRAHLGELLDSGSRIRALEAELLETQGGADALESASRSAVTRLGLDRSLSDLVAGLGPEPAGVVLPALGALGADATDMFSGGALHLPSGQAFPVGFGQVVVGGADDADIVLRDPSMRPRHATITFDRGRHVIAAIDGALRVDGRACQEAALADGTRVELGDVGVVFRTSLPIAAAQRAAPTPVGASATMLTTRSQVEAAIAQATLTGRQDTFVLQRPLLVIREGGRTRSMRLDLGQVTIGSGPDDDIVIESLVPQHAAIHFENDGFVTVAVAGAIEVNARATTRAPLADGDVIRLGPAEIQFCESSFRGE